MFSWEELLSEEAEVAEERWGGGDNSADFSLAGVATGLRTSSRATADVGDVRRVIKGDAFEAFDIGRKVVQLSKSTAAFLLDA